MPPPPILDPTTIDCNHVVADLQTIRAVNLQRFEMEALTAIVHLDTVNKVIVGYRDVTEEDFWVRGHMPNFPLMPGVLLCETAAQLCSYFVMTQHVIDEGHLMGFGGTENVRFRAVVRPGDRLIIARGILTRDAVLIRNFR